ncbi:unnamed protein product [Parascedosporium putredinis]|uniref:GPI inositol-deacylase winged helix domain-containing protein n=1 Tax=Parascedosporium putredinis TaxID=1442378 RepID=A0A9P1H4S3_9PEZI|nr:unnamed protein product [Parascedosporium putredinis]CAI7996865.1 unnamed protein product [Parascedosporium putredinis]
MDRIPAELKHDAIRLLQFLVHSRPLKLAEAKEVIATQVQNESQGFDIKRRLFHETNILEYCPGLITVVHATKELHLAHFSVKEYLLKEDQFEMTIASFSIARTCLTYLTDIKSSHSEIREDFPMAIYAAEMWPRHAISAQALEDMVQMAVEFIENEATFQRWTALWQPYEPLRNFRGGPKASRLYYASLNGLMAPACDLIGKGVDVNAQGGYFGNALQAASFHGHSDTVQMLMEKGANVNAQGGHHGNALQAASLCGHSDTVQMLIEKGADANTQGGFYGNALQAASSRGHSGIIQMLMEKGADVNTQGGGYSNAL